MFQTLECPAFFYALHRSIKPYLPRYGFRFFKKSLQSRTFPQRPPRQELKFIGEQWEILGGAAYTRLEDFEQTTDGRSSELQLDDSYTLRAGIFLQ